jgi:hypothetical protein
MGVYQQLSISTRQSRWILIQPSQHVENRLKEFLNTQKSDQLAFNGDVLEPHVTILITLARHWREYLEYIESQINETVRGVENIYVETLTLSRTKRLAIRELGKPSNMIILLLSQIASVYSNFEGNY